MNAPYIEVGLPEVYHYEEDVFWIVTKDDDGFEVGYAMFSNLEDAKEYLHKVKGIPLEEIKIVTGEE